jgi:hypothetical protein
MNEHVLAELHAFIVQAKAATYVGGGAKASSSRIASHDLQYLDGDWSYLDSYFGGTDFIGQETVWHVGRPVWCMNYYGHISKPELITPNEAGQMIKASLSELYAEGRFLGGFRHTEGLFTYIDINQGEFVRFTGREWIERDGVEAYDLTYHGGLIIE